MSSTPDLAQIRFQNAMVLFDEFVNNTVKHPDAATLRGLEGRFAQKLQLQASYWSQIKGRSRQIGERLARQFEQLCHKPNGWMDQLQHATGASPVIPQPAVNAGQDSSGPQDDDERFIVGGNFERYGFLNLPVYPDPKLYGGSLYGLARALELATSSRVAISACDTPNLTRNYWEFMANFSEL